MKLVRGRHRWMRREPTPNPINQAEAELHGALDAVADGKIDRAEYAWIDRLTEAVNLSDDDHPLRAHEGQSERRDVEPSRSRGAGKIQAHLHAGLAHDFVKYAARSDARRQGAKSLPARAVRPYIFLRFLTLAPTPIKPAPSRRSDAGSGIAA